MFHAPMLLETHKEGPFDDERYVYQPKIDGHRMVWTRMGGKVRIYTRHRTDVTDRYPELHHLPLRIEGDVVLDGEVAVLDPAAGREDFDLMQDRFRIKRPEKMASAMRDLPVTFFPFDMLIAKGADLRPLPLTERLTRLQEWLGPGTAFMQPVMTVDGTGKRLFDAARQRGLEGIVAKRKDSRYVGQRSAMWLKILNEQPHDVVITGIRREEFGLLIARLDEAGRPVHAGLLEFGVSPEEKQALYAISRSIVTGQTKAYTYLQPLIRCRVRARGVTHSGHLRVPVFEQFLLNVAAGA